MRLLRTEMRRALHRRVVRVLVLLALLGCAMAGVIAFLSSQDSSVAELRLGEDGHPAIMTDWWILEEHEGFLLLGSFFLLLGGLVGGATVAGGEWRAGTVTTVLTWEPRRARLHAARTTSALLLALVIAAALQVVFLASFLPAVFAHGTTDGVDGAFWVGLGGAILRTSLLTAGAAALAVALATVARNTAFAVTTAFVWMAVIEGLIRSLRPGMARWLWAENVGTVIQWRALSDADFHRGPALAATTLLVYCTLVVVGAAISFQRRDIAATT